jgi:3-hydroxyisobutyrate dehydrogenase
VRVKFLSVIFEPNTYNDVVRAASAAATLVTMLPSSPEVTHVYGSSDGILTGLKNIGDGAKETLCIDGTTLNVDVARKVATDVTGTGAEMVDAPVSGGTYGLCGRRGCDLTSS